MFRVQGFGLGVQVFAFLVFRVFMIWGSVFSVECEGSGLRVQGVGLRVSGFELVFWV